MSEASEKPRPLSSFIWGTTSLHFRASRRPVTLRMTQADARALNGVVTGERSGAKVTWSDPRWIAFDETRVDALEWEMDEDGGLRMSSPYRTQLETDGHPHGIIKPLVEHWERRGTEPRYTVDTLALILRTMVDLPETDLGAVADLLEGDHGVELLTEARRRAREDTEQDGGDQGTEQDDAETARTGNGSVDVGDAKPDRDPQAESVDQQDDAP